MTIFQQVNEQGLEKHIVLCRYPSRRCFML